AFALVAMAAVFGASARATFASMVFVFEVTRDYQIILPLMLASVVADIIATALMRESLMTEKLSRRGLRVHAEYEVDVFRTTRVRDVMATTVTSLPESATVADVRARAAAGAGATPAWLAAGPQAKRSHGIGLSTPRRRHRSASQRAGGLTARQSAARIAARLRATLGL